MPSASSRSESLREQARVAILNAAIDVFGESGFAEGTTAAVAARAGVSKGLVFNYFPTKDDLLQALVEKMLGQALDFWESHPWEGSPRDQLASWIESAMAQVLRRPGFYRLYFSLALQPGGSAAVDRALTNLKPRLELYLARVEALVRSAGSAAPPLDARLLQCAVNGLAQALVAGPGFAAEGGMVPVAPLRERLLDLFAPPATPDQPR